MIFNCTSRTTQTAICKANLSILRCICVLLLLSAAFFIACDTPRPPISQSPTILSLQFTVGEDQIPTRFFGIVEASDSQGDRLSYRIVQNSPEGDAGIFTIDRNNGRLSIADGRVLDFETSVSHTIKVEVSDGTNSTQAEISITVTDVLNDPEFFGNMNFTVAEDASGVLAHVQAMSPVQLALFFGILPPNNTVFAIDNAGSITLRAGQNLDLTRTARHRLSIQVRDSTGNTARTEVTINVTNIAEEVESAAPLSVSF